MDTFEPGQIWIERRPRRFFGLQLGTRMTVVRLAGGELFVHSPTRLDPPTREALDALGPVRYVVSPNRLHHVYMQPYFGAYPDARVYASPGLAKKRRDLRFHAELADAPEPGGADEIDQTIFLGHPLVREVVFFHRESRTLLLADLLEHISEDDAPLTRLAARIAGMYRKPVPPTDFRFTITDRSAARLSARRILDWDFDRIILSHGRLVGSDGKDAFRRAFHWLIRD